jgi:hypothetical protein
MKRDGNRLNQGRWSSDCNMGFAYVSHDMMKKKIASCERKSSCLRMEN